MSTADTVPRGLARQFRRVKRLGKGLRGLRCRLAAAGWFLQGFCHACLRPRARRVYFVNWFFRDPREFEQDFFFRSLRAIHPNTVVSAFRPHVVFYSVFGPRERAKQAFPRARKVFYTGENLRRPQFAAYADHCLGEVDLALGFESIEHPRYLRFPCWMMFFEYGDAVSAQRLRELVAGINRARSTGERYCALIANHAGGDIREEMRNAVEVDGQRVSCPGTAFHNDDSLRQMERDGRSHKIEYLSHFRFTVCPENSVAPGYVTEKLFHAFQAGAIAIYSGASADPEPGVFNPDSFLYWRAGEANTELLDRMRRLWASPEEFRAFLSQPRILPAGLPAMERSFQEVFGRLLGLLGVQGGWQFDPSSRTEP